LNLIIGKGFTHRMALILVVDKGEMKGERR